MGVLRNTVSEGATATCVCNVERDDRQRENGVNRLRTREHQQAQQDSEPTCEPNSVHGCLRVAVHPDSQPEQGSAPSRPNANAYLDAASTYDRRQSTRMNGL